MILGRICKRNVLNKNVSKFHKSPKRCLQQQNNGGYLKKLELIIEKKPFIANSFIGGFFMFAGDLTQQMLFNDKIKPREVYF